MHVTVMRTGGYAGRSEQVASVDTARLPAAEARQVEQAVRQSGFFGLSADAAPGAVGADLFRYEITVRDGGRAHTVTFADDGGPETEPLRRLIGALTGTP